MAFTDEQIDHLIGERGCIACIGQISDAQKRRLDRRVKTGELAKWRATWTAPLGGYGIGPLKTVYGLAHLNPTVPVAA